MLVLELLKPEFVFWHEDDDDDDDDDEEEEDDEDDEEEEETELVWGLALFEESCVWDSAFRIAVTSPGKITSSFRFSGWGAINTFLKKIKSQIWISDQKA